MIVTKTVCRLPLVGLLVLSLFISCMTPSGQAQSQENSSDDGNGRNIIFILSDDHRYDFMSFHEGSPDFLETPAMDRMAEEGTHVANAFVSTSLCSPSRASILTGQYAHRHGVVDNQRNVPEGTTFFSTELQDAGYNTSFIGKWHMGSSSAAPRKGFDHWISYRGQGSYYNPTLNVNGEEVTEKGYTASIVTDRAINWMKQQQNEEDPFFLYLSHKSVHARFKPAKQDRGRYADVEPAYPKTMKKNVEGRDTWPDWVKKQRSSWHGVDYMYHGDLDYDTFYRRYAETLYSMDREIGRLLDFLEQSDLDEDTIVIYMGDNGFSFGEHGLIDKRQAFEESMRVPMLIWAPGLVDGGTRIEKLVQNIDLAPTFLDIAGGEMPADHEVDGRSFLPLLQGKSTDWRDGILYEYYWEWNFPQTPTQFAYRTDRYKYIFFYGLWDDNALFDLKSDPAEQFNLINKKKHKERANRMRRKLFQKLKETSGMEIPLKPPRGFRADKTRPEGEKSTDPLTK